jgi:hypothetical protein
MAAFQGFAVHLTLVFQQTQQFGDTAVSDLVPHPTQGRRELRSGPFPFMHGPSSSGLLQATGFAEF